MGDAEERHRFVEQVRKSCRIARKLRELGIRPFGIVRIDSATDPATWARDPEGSKKIASTFRECCQIAEDMTNVWLPKARFAGVGCTVGSE